MSKPSDLTSEILLAAESRRQARLDSLAAAKERHEAYARRPKHVSPSMANNKQRRNQLRQFAALAFEAAELLEASGADTNIHHTPNEPKPWGRLILARAGIIKPVDYRGAISGWVLSAQSYTNRVQTGKFHEIDYYTDYEHHEGFGVTPSRDFFYFEAERTSGYEHTEGPDLGEQSGTKTDVDFAPRNVGSLAVLCDDTILNEPSDYLPDTPPFAGPMPPYDLQTWRDRVVSFASRAIAAT